MPFNGRVPILVCVSRIRPIIWVAIRIIVTRIIAGVTCVIVPILITCVRIRRAIIGILGVV
jgi:hypothetical protein